MDKISLSTGTKRIAIERDGVVTGELKFNPSDATFAERFYNLYSELTKKLEEYDRKAKALAEQAQADGYGVPDNAKEQLDVLLEGCRYLRDKIDELFGAGTSEAAFGDVLDPGLFIQLLTAIMPFFEEARQEKTRRYLNDELVGKVMK